MKIQPTRDHVIVKVDIPKEIKSKGIILNANKQKPQCMGTVEAIGSGRVLNDGTILPMAVKLQDKVLFYDYVGTIIEQTPNYILLLIKENDIMAVIED